MNVWDILILLAVAGMLAAAIIIRTGKNKGCHGQCASCCQECEKKGRR